MGAFVSESVIRNMLGQSAAFYIRQRRNIEFLGKYTTIKVNKTN